VSFDLLGWPADGPTLRLDYRRFSYAGKFVMSATGKAVVRDPDAAAPESEYDEAVLAAISFDPDRTDERTLCLRYVTVRRDHRGEGLGPRLAAFVASKAADEGYDRVRIAVNNPFAYEAMYRAGFAFTGDETGLAELVLERPAGAPADRDAERYREGFDRYRDRDLDDPARTFVDRKRDGTPPALVDVPVDA
jgi:GNAT superfamily N-acetyltransferase